MVWGKRGLAAVYASKPRGAFSRTGVRVQGCDRDRADLANPCKRPVTQMSGPINSATKPHASDSFIDITCSHFGDALGSLLSKIFSAISYI